jgi:hypothetical protein
MVAHQAINHNKILTMKKLFCISLILSFALSAHNQTFITRNGNVSFYSHTPVEDIKADNNEAVSVLNASTGDIEFKIAIKSFHFSKTAMEEHFNDDDYMGSEKFPKADFKGKINNISSINFLKDGTYNVSINGTLTIKDVTKPVSSQGTITVKTELLLLQQVLVFSVKIITLLENHSFRKKLQKKFKSM